MVQFVDKKQEKKLSIVVNSFQKKNIELFYNKFYHHMKYQKNLLNLDFQIKRFRFPNSIKKFDVLSSPHVNKKSYEQLQSTIYKRGFFLKYNNLKFLPIVLSCIKAFKEDKNNSLYTKITISL